MVLQADQVPYTLHQLISQSLLIVVPYFSLMKQRHRLPPERLPWDFETSCVLDSEPLQCLKRFYRQEDSKYKLEKLIKHYLGGLAKSPYRNYLSYLPSCVNSRGWVDRELKEPERSTSSSFVFNANLNVTQLLQQSEGDQHHQQTAEQLTETIAETTVKTFDSCDSIEQLLHEITLPRTPQQKWDGRFLNYTPYARKTKSFPNQSARHRKETQKYEHRYTQLQLKLVWHRPIKHKTPLILPYKIKNSIKQH